MKDWADIFAVDRSSSLTMTGQLADAIRKSIRKGRLSEGDVLPPAANTWRGYVLIVSRRMGTYHYDTQAAILRDRLSRAGFFVSQSFVFWREGRQDFSQLDEALTQGWGIAEHIRQKGVRLTWRWKSDKGLMLILR